MELLIALATTVLGVVLSQMVSRWDSWYQTIRRSDLRGEWLALDCYDYNDSFVEKVTISRKLGRLHIRNYENKAGQIYEAHCSVEEPGILTGRWRSTRPGAITSGRILLVISPQATSLTGVYSGHFHDGRHVLCFWILGRNEESLRRAIKTASTTIPDLKHIDFGKHSTAGDLGHTGLNLTNGPR
jgi:hypothetical protein